MAVPHNAKPDRTAARDALQAAMIESSPAVMYVKDLQGRYVFANRQFEVLFHIDRNEAEGKTDSDLFPKKHAGIFRANDQRVLRTGQPEEREEIVQLEDGLHTFVSLKFPIHDRSGSVCASGGISVDITRHAEEHLQLSEERYRALIENAMDIVVILDSQGVRTYASPSVERVLGFTPAELAGQNVFDLIHPEDVPTLRTALLRGSRKPDATARFEYRIRHKDGTWRSLEAVGRNLLDNPAVSGIVINARDVTERKQAEEALRQSEAELHCSHEQLQALTARLLTAEEQERRRLSRELHDDLNQRLALLALDVESLFRQLPSSPVPIMDLLHSLEDGVAELSEDIRRMAYQLHPSILDDLGLVPALRSYCRNFSRRDAIRVRFTHRNVPDSVPQDVALCLYRVTQECLGNVARHSGAKQAAVILAGGNRHLCLRVVDHGAGFRPEAVRGRGGLGIVSMQERVRLVQGVISVNSRPGRGTRIEVRIPMTQESA